MALEEGFDSTVHAAMYGPVEAVRTMGNDLQQRIFVSFQSQLRRGLPSAGEAPSDVAMLLEQGLARGLLMSASALAEKSGQPENTAKRNVLRLASVLVHSATWMAGAFCSCWRTMFRKRLYQPIATLARWKYDETPLKMRVQEQEACAGIDRRGGDSLVPSGRGLEQAYLHSKVFHSRWEYGISS